MKSVILAILMNLILGLISVPAFAYSPQPGDTIEVQILNKKELNTRQIIAPDGTISLPFIGRTKVDGKSLETIDSQLKTEFAKYIQSPTIVVQVDQLKKPDTKADSYYVTLADSEKGTIEVKSVKTLSEAMAWTAGNNYQAYRVAKSGQKVAISPTDNLVLGDFLVVDLAKNKTQPIYLCFYDLSKNLIDLKKAQSVSEALGWTASKPYQLVKGAVTSQNATTIEPGDTLIVTIGKPDNWLEDNWYKILTGAAVVVGLFNSLK